MSTRCNLGPQFAPAFHRPFLRYIEGETGGGEGGDGGQQNNEPAFPANTPVKDMTPEQQAAYWQDKSRKHENRTKALGDWTPEKIKELEKERDALRSKTQTDTEKELEKARSEGRAEGIAEANKVKATYALEKALVGRVPAASALLGLDVTKFVVNGQIDDVAVKAWVEEHSEEAPKGGQQKKGPDLGQGGRGNAGGSGKSVAGGRELYAERHKKSTATNS